MSHTHFLRKWKFAEPTAFAVMELGHLEEQEVNQMLLIVFETIDRKSVV